MEPADIAYCFPRQVIIWLWYLLNLTCLAAGNSWMNKVPCTGKEPVGTVPWTAHWKAVIYSLLYINIVACEVVEFIPRLGAWRPFEGIRRKMQCSEFRIEIIKGRFKSWRLHEDKRRFVLNNYLGSSCNVLRSMICMIEC